MADDMRNPQQDQRPGGPGRPGGPRPAGPLNVGLLLMIMLIAFLAVYVYQTMRHGKEEEISLDAFYSKLEKGQIESVLVRDSTVTGRYRGPIPPEKAQKYFVKIMEPEIARISEAVEKFRQPPTQGTITYTQDPGNPTMQFIIGQLLPILLIGLFIWWLMARQFRSAGGAGGVLSFGKARAKLHTKEQSNVTFDQVAGVDEAKEEVMELVEFLKNPSKFRRLGGRIPRGVILIGPPGTGKTLLAKAIAGEAEVPFYSISGSDFVEMFVGVGASRVRDLFRQAKESAPCIIFLDEIDAVGRRRAIDIHGASAESAQTLNAILVEMDGFETDDTVIVIAATNRPDVLDPALLRPGRFDRQIVVDLPDIRGREAILRVHARKYKLAADVDLKTTARGTPTFSGADLEALMNEGALIATRSGKSAVTMEDLEEARDKVRWGRQRRSRAMTEEDRRITAFHESGHAVVAKLIPDAEPLHKVSIIPQGMALGMTMLLPERDRYHVQRKRMTAQLAVLLAGRAAEEIFCDDITSGAQSDLTQATEIARSMVCQWGMSDVIGPIAYHETEEHSFLGPDTHRTIGCSDTVAVKIDEEVSRFIRDAYSNAHKLLSDRRADVDRIVTALLKYEVLYDVDVDKLLAGEEITREVPPSSLTADGLPRQPRESAEI